MGPLIAALPAIGAVAGLAGTAVSVAGAMQAGEAQAANARYQAQVARNNAQIAQQNAAWTMQSGETSAATQGAKGKAAIGELLAAQGSNNVDVNSGSSADVRTSAQALADLDTKTIMSNASRTAFGYQVAASSDNAQAGLYTQEANQAESAAPINALGSFLSGISSVGSNWAKFQGPSATAAGVDPNVGGPMQLQGAT